jgi:hypothetical protein
MNNSRSPLSCRVSKSGRRARGRAAILALVVLAILLVPAAAVAELWRSSLDGLEYVQVDKMRVHPELQGAQSRRRTAIC